MTKTEASLRGRITVEKRNLHKSDFKLRAYEWLRGIYYPSTASLTIVAGLLAVAFAWALWNGRCANSADLAKIARLQPLGVGIALVFVPITVFVVGLSSRKTPSGVSLAEILLKETYLFPIAVFVIGLLAIFVVVSTVEAARVIILITAVLAIFTLYKLVQVLLDGDRQYLSGLDYVKDRITRSIDLAIDERIGRNLLLRALDGMKLEYSPFAVQTAADEVFTIRHTEQGRVCDVLLDRLEQFSEELERIANENGYAFVEKQVPWSTALVLGDINLSGRTLTALKSRCLTVLYSDSVEGEHLVIARVPQKLVPEESERQYLGKLARRAIQLGPQEPHLERIKRLMAEIKDQAVEAIRSAQTGRLSDLLNVYKRAAETFLERMKTFQTVHSFSRARLETNSLLGGWNEVKWMRDDLAEIHRRACLSDDVIIVRDVISIPFAIALASIRARDHLIFREFISFARLLYSSSKTVKVDDVRKLLFDRSWRYPVDLADYGVQWELQHSPNDANALETVSDFGITIFSNFQDLMRSALDSRDYCEFEAFARAAQGLFGRLSTTTSSDAELVSLRVRIEMLVVQGRSTVQVAKRIRELEQLENVREKLTSRKHQMLFGVGSLVLEKLLESPTDESIRKCLDSVVGLLGGDPLGLTKLFSDAYQDDTQELWGWHWWTRIPEHGGFVGGPIPRLTDFYCYTLLKACQAFTPAHITEMELPLGRDILFDVGNQSRVVATFHEFANSRTKWALIVPEPWLAAVGPFDALFARLVSSQKRNDEDLDIEANLSSLKIGEFEVAFRSKFHKSAGMRSIFKYFHAFTDETTQPSKQDGAVIWGLNSLNDKKTFIDHSDYPCKEIGENFAWQLSQSESSTVLDIILDQLRLCDCPDVPQIDEKLRVLVGSLSRAGSKANLLIVGLEVKQLMELEDAPSFSPKWRDKKSPWHEMQNFEGTMSVGGEDIPVFWFRPAKMGSFACVLDLPRCLNWRQESPLESGERQAGSPDLFSVHFADLAKDHELREKLLSENPPWLQQQDDRDRYLRLRVNLRILEKFKIELLDDLAGCKIIL